MNCATDAKARLNPATKPGLDYVNRAISVPVAFISVVSKEKSGHPNGDHEKTTRQRGIMNKDEAKEKAAQLRAGGYSYRRIAGLVGYGPTAVQKWLDPAFANRRADYEQTAKRRAVKQNHATKFPVRCQQALNDSKKRARLHGHAACTASVDDLLRAWTGRCHICGKLEADCGPKKLSVEHCHDTGKFRGWACLGCNTALARANDSPELLRRMADFLEGKINPNEHWPAA